MAQTVLGTTVVMITALLAFAAYYSALVPAFRAISTSLPPALNEMLANVFRVVDGNGGEDHPVVPSMLSDFRADPATGINFPIYRNFEVGKKMKLLGVGTRKKAVLKVYSVGFYGSAPVVKALRDKSGEEACGAMMEPKLKGSKAAVLEFNMGVGTDKMAEAMSNIDGMSQEVKDEFMALLKNGLSQGKMRKGESMTFEWKGKKLVMVTVNGENIGELKDQRLYQGLLKIYFGDKSVSPSLKADLGSATDQ